MRTRQAGVVLALTLLMLIAVTALVHGSIVIASALTRGGDEAWRAVQARRAAGAAATMVTGADSVSAYFSLTVAEDVRVEVRAHPLGREVTLVAAEAQAGPARWWAGRLRWFADAETRAVESPVIAVGGRLAGPGPGARLERGGAECGLPAPPPQVGPVGWGGPRVGPLDPLALAERLRGAGGLLDACPDLCPPRARVADGPLALSSGRVTGLLLVLGDLQLSGDVRVEGTLLVDGDVTIDETAVVHGALQLSGDLVLTGGALVRADPCVVRASWAGGVASDVGSVALDPAPWALWAGIP